VLVAGNGSRITNICWAAAGGISIWALARLVAADRVHRAESLAVPLVTLTPQVAAVSPWAALGLRLARRRGPAALAAVAATALGLMVRSRRVPSPQPAAAGPMLRVLSINMLFGQADAEVIVALVREAGVDVLFVQELTADAVTRLKQAGLDDLLPHTQLELRGSAHGARGSGIYGRFPLREGPSMPPSFMAQPTALLELPSGESVELICAHPCAPGVRRWRGPTRWRAELGGLPAPGELPRVLAGDFNATLDHAAFRQVLRLGYADAAQETGKGLVPTWGLPGKSALFPLDHVLVDRGCAVRAFSVHAVPYSDHRAVYAQIQLPGRQP
jgi:endonuclease/exonuclease/phosphatase family metal-dependent hydrolase